jgi:hypothetical protein
MRVAVAVEVTVGRLRICSATVSKRCDIKVLFVVAAAGFHTPSSQSNSGCQWGMSL